MDFLQELGRRIANTTAEQGSFMLLMRRLSVAVPSASLALHRRPLVWTM